MTCGMCPFTDGMCYTSNPPKRKCEITGEFHYYYDECNCECSRLLKEKEKSGESLIERFPKSTIMLNIDNIIAGEYEFPSAVPGYICEPATTFGVPGLICEETVFVDFYGAGQRICDSCKEAVKFVKDKLMEKKDD